MRIEWTGHPAGASGLALRPVTLRRGRGERPVHWMEDIMAVRSERLPATLAGKPAKGPSDVATCPLCNGANDCAIAAGDAVGEGAEPCWCVGHTFDSRLFALVSANDLGRRCVCAQCAFDPTLIEASRRKVNG